MLMQHIWHFKCFNELKKIISAKWVIEFENAFLLWIPLQPVWKAIWRYDWNSNQSLFIKHAQKYMSTHKVNKCLLISIFLVSLI